MSRFLRNASVTVDAMAAEAGRFTASRCQGRSILAIQDTTVVRSQGGGGLYLHPVLAVDADDGTIVGLIHGCFLQREAGRRAERRGKPVAAKESQRWLDGARQAGRCAVRRRA